MTTVKTFCAALLAVACFVASSARADEETFLDCLRDCDCGQFNCVVVDIDCCECEGATGPLRVEFLDADGNVLGAGEVAPDWCGGDNCDSCDRDCGRCGGDGCDRCGGDRCGDDCNRDDEMSFMLDNAVNVEDVCSIRLVKADGDPSSLWISIKVGLEDECDCDVDWCTLWKGDICDWSPIAEVMAPPPPPEPMPAPRPAPAPERPLPPPPAPRPQPRPAPAPAPEPIPIVPGNG